MSEDVVRGVFGLLAAEEGPTAQPSWRRVLLVDDDPTILRFVAAVLTSAGYEVATAADGLDAVATIEAAPPDFLITDWKMPNFDGIELCRWIRQARLPHYIYTILMTARTEVRHMVEAISAGADDFFSKPVRPGELLSRMQAGTRILERERRLLFLSRHDELTELYNRRAFYHRGRELWEETAATDAPLSCAMLDLDHFKRVNDELGHAAGDSALAAAADMLRRSLPDDAVAGRLGGEEFCVLLPGRSLHEARRWADSLRFTLAQAVICCEGAALSITVSAGVALRTPETIGFEQLLNQADRALREAKQQGRNCVCCYETHHGDPHAGRLI